MPYLEPHDSHDFGMCCDDCCDSFCNLCGAEEFSETSEDGLSADAIAPCPSRTQPCQRREEIKVEDPVAAHIDVSILRERVATLEMALETEKRLVKALEDVIKAAIKSEEKQ